ncbi:MAG: hypothetical protein J7485_14110 [Sphingobium sp.]|nr:hypothetical protein [Sphingobium sp.]
MLLSFRRAFWAAAVLGLWAVPVHATSTQGVLTEVQAYASQAGDAIAAFVHAISAGDMPSIQKAGFALSGLIALIGLWLLVIRPRIVEHEEVRPEAEEVAAAEAESEVDRPTRLLEAIAAAKAQMSISEAEKKHSR